MKLIREEPRISVITVTRNDVLNLGATLGSVASQSYPNVEHVIIDGASTDSTPELLASYSPDFRVQILSEPDRGIFDAMNKGLRMCTGDLIVMMNGGDTFSSSTDLQFVSERYTTEDWEWAYGAMRTVDASRSPIRGSVQAPFSRKRLEMGIGFVPHQAMYLTRMAAERLGPYDSTFGIAADQEMALRAAMQWKPAVWVEFLADCLEDGAHAQVTRLQRERLYRLIRRNHDALVGSNTVVDLLYTTAVAVGWTARDFAARRFRNR